MREATSGTTLPKCTYTWLIADQAVASLAGFTPAHIACPGARAGNGIPVASARAQLPLVFGGTSRPNLSAFVDADNFVTLTISNNGSAALTATAADIPIDIMVLPLNP